MPVKKADGLWNIMCRHRDFHTIISDKELIIHYVLKVHWGGQVGGSEYSNFPYLSTENHLMEVGISMYVVQKRKTTTFLY